MKVTLQAKSMWDMLKLLLEIKELICRVWDNTQTERIDGKCSLGSYSIERT